MDYNNLAKEIHAENQTWWVDPATGEPLHRNRGELYALMHSELSEALEGMRKDKMDDHLPHRKAVEVELADFMIRALDYLGNRDIKVASDFAVKVSSHGPQVIADLHRDLSRAYAEPGRQEYLFSRIFGVVSAFCRMNGLDLAGAMAEKRAYNRERADHKPEARLAAGGKRF